MPSTRSTTIQKGTPNNGADAIKKSRSERLNPLQAKKQRRRAKPVHDEWQALHALFQRFLASLVENDHFHLLSKESDDENAITLAWMQKRLKEEDYVDAREFKDDLDGLFQATASGLGSDPAHRIAHDRLRQFAASALSFEVRRQGQTIVPIGPDEEPSETPIPTALFRPSPDGFFFSRTCDKKRSDDTILPGNIQELVLHPTPPDAIQIPTLGKSVPPSKDLPRQRDKKVKPTQWLGYGAYSSYMPAYDSNDANVSYESSYMGRAAKRFRKHFEKQRTRHLAKAKSPPKPGKSDAPHTQSASDSKGEGESAKANGITDKESAQTTHMDEDIDMAWLESHGLDAESIVRAAREGHMTVDGLLMADPSDMNKTLERNSQLIEKLLQYQEYRFGLTEDQWSAVSDKEMQLAKALEARMTQLVATMPPNTTHQDEDVQTAMARLPLKDATYRGTLPLNKLFAFSSDKTGDPPLYAGVTPTYAPDRWRIVGEVPMQAHPSAGFFNPYMMPFLPGFQSMPPTMQR